MWLFFAFLIVPLIEITLFIQIGGAIGLGWTLFTVVLTAILGTWLVRSQGLAVMQQLRGSLSQMRDPTEALVHGAMILFSGALLLTPGFFTDAVGFALLVPGLRRAMFQALRSRIHIHSAAQTHPQDDIIDADYTDLGPRDAPSGWTKH